MPWYKTALRIFLHENDMRRLIWYCASASMLWDLWFLVWCHSEFWVIPLIVWVLVSLMVAVSIFPKFLFDRAQISTGIIAHETFFYYLKHPTKCTIVEERLWYEQAAEGIKQISVPMITTTLGLFFTYVFGVVTALITILISIYLAEGSHSHTIKAVKSHLSSHATQSPTAHVAVINFVPPPVINSLHFLIVVAVSLFVLTVGWIAESNAKQEFRRYCILLEEHAGYQTWVPKGADPLGVLDAEPFGPLSPTGGKRI